MRLEAVLARAREGGSGALIVDGDPGIGKSTLLEHCVARAEGFVVLRAHPLESEMELPFAGLSDLLRPLLPLVERLPEPQAARSRPRSRSARRRPATASPWLPRR